MFCGKATDFVRVGLYRGEPWFWRCAEAIHDRSSAICERLRCADIGYAADPAVESFGRLGRGILRIDQHEIPFRVLLGYLCDAAYEAAPVCARPLRRDGNPLLAFHAAHYTKLSVSRGVLCR